MRITNVQKKELSDILRMSKLNILDFTSTGTYKEFIIKFKADFFAFSINKTEDDKYAVTVYPVNNTKGFSFNGNWADVIGYFTNWISQISVELNTPTGWETFESEDFLNVAPSDLSEEFSPEDKKVIGENITILIARIKTLELPEETLKTIELKLEQLNEKVDKMNKFDWKSLFIGTIASLIMTFSIPPEAAGLFWEYLKTSFSGLKLKS